MMSWLSLVVCLCVACPAMAAEKPRLKPSDFRLVGGWRLAQEYPRGALAIDFDNGRVFIGGHAQRQEIVEFSLMGRSEETGNAREDRPRHR